MSKYTNGTWVYEPKFLAIVVYANLEMRVVADFGKVSLPETEDNARLMSASKDLLNALKKAVSEIEWWENEHECCKGKSYDTLLVARAAIAKTEGTGT